MLLSDARLEVRERIGELVAYEDFFTTSEVDRAINEATRRFSAEERWPWLLTVGTDALAEDEWTIELTDGIAVSRFMNIMLDADDIIQPIILERVDQSAGFRLRAVNRFFVAPPRYYYLEYGTPDSGETRYSLRVVPAADRDYDIEYQYYRVPEDATGASDVIDVPQEYADAVPAWAAGKLFLKELSISNKAGEQFAIYGQIVEQARKETFERNYDETTAWGRSHPGETGVVGEYDYVMRRIGGEPLGS